MLMKYNKKSTFRQHINEQNSLNIKITSKYWGIQIFTIALLTKQIHFVYI
jgi:hypothetical protein